MPLLGNFLLPLLYESGVLRFNEMRRFMTDCSQNNDLILFSLNRNFGKSFRKLYKYCFGGLSYLCSRNLKNKKR